MLTKEYVYNLLFWTITPAVAFAMSFFGYFTLDQVFIMLVAWIVSPLFFYRALAEIEEKDDAVSENL